MHRSRLVLRQHAATAAAAGVALAILTGAAVRQANRPGTPIPQTSAAMRVAIDPETGGWTMPAPDPAAELPQDKTAEPRWQPLAGGGEVLDLPEWTRSYSVARIEADGSVATDCVTGADAARQFLLGAPAAAPVQASVGEVR